MPSQQVRSFIRVDKTMSAGTERRYVGYSEALAYGFAAGGKSFVTTLTQSGYLSLFYMELETGERNEGVSFAVSSFFGKLTSSVSTAIATAVLPIIGLTYQTVNGRQVAVKGEKTDFYIWMFYVLVPQLLNTLGMIPFFWYDLTGKRLADIREQLKEYGEMMLAELSETEDKK